MKTSVMALLCAICLYAPAFSQTVPSVKSIDGVVACLQTLSADKAIEKAYLHFDRSYYNAGDTVYFKAYVTLGEQRELTKLSGLLHVDFINSEDSLLKTISLQLVNGLAHGDFNLDGTLPAGTYRVRAYTRWMLNNGQANFFNQSFFIANTSIATEKKPQSATAKPQIQFFPEGGNLVNGVPAKLAFKAAGPNGAGINVKGVIVDNSGTEVIRFESKHLGMGMAFITPQAGKSYKANLIYADGTKAVVALPEAYNEGITLAVNNTNPDKLNIEINANKAYYLKNKNKEFGIIIYSGGSVRTVKTLLDNQVLALDLKKKDFKTGIVQITLFSAQGEPLNERIAFIQNPDLLSITVRSDKVSYAPGDKVQISIDTKNKEGMPISGFFSATIIDEGKVFVNEDTETTILSNLLLTSDLQGEIEQPNYYFNNVKSDTRADLDVLMLTQGYRRFEWKQLLNSNGTAATYKAEAGFDISGKVKTLKGIPVNSGTITLMPQTGGTILTQVTDHEGNFTFANLVYDDKTRFILQAKTVEESSNTQILINEPEQLSRIEPAGLQIPTMPASGSASPPVYLADISKKVATIATTDKRILTNDKINNSVNKKNLQDQASLSAGIQGRLNGVIIRQGVPYLSDRVNAATQSGPMLVIVDGTPLPQGAGVDNYNPSDIERVEVLKNTDASIYGVRGANGVLILKTRKNAAPVISNNTLSPGLLYYTANGFYKARAFYTPVYDGSKTRDYNADNRSTIYWKPNLVTDNEGNVSFSFFNVNAKGNYRLVVEGTDGKGNLGRSILTYKVE